MSTTGTAIDPAKLRQGARDELASLAVEHGIIDALTAVVDEHWDYVHRSEGRLRMIFDHLGCPELAKGLAGDATVLAKLDEMDAAAKAGDAGPCCTGCGPDCGCGGTPHEAPEATP